MGPAPAQPPSAYGPTAANSDYGSPRWPIPPGRLRQVLEFQDGPAMVAGPFMVRLAGEHDAGAVIQTETRQ